MNSRLKVHPEMRCGPPVRPVRVPIPKYIGESVMDVEMMGKFQRFLVGLDASDLADLYEIVRHAAENNPAEASFLILSEVKAEVEYREATRRRRAQRQTGSRVPTDEQTTRSYYEK